MARQPIPAELPVPGSIEGVLTPAEHPGLIGHESQQAEFLSAVGSGQLHHAWLLKGPFGIGKATFALRAAACLLSDDRTGAPESGFSIDRENPAFSKIARGSHPNLLHLQVPWDAKAKRFKTALTVDEIRRLTPFVGSTSGEGRWRVIIVDAADEMNRNAANALLKSLEEPPAETIFFLISHASGRLLPTILSRCRVLTFRPLSAGQIRSVVKDVAPDLSADSDFESAISLSSGSPRRTMEYVTGGLDLYRNMISALSDGTQTGFAAIASGAADSRSGSFERFLSLYRGFLHRRIAGLDEPVGDVTWTNRVPLVTWAKLWEKAAVAEREVETFNLDRKQFVLDLMEETLAATTAS